LPHSFRYRRDGSAVSAENAGHFPGALCRAGVSVSAVYDNVARLLPINTERSDSGWRKRKAHHGLAPCVVDSAANL
jgi:hypothetical protein